MKKKEAQQSQQQKKNTTHWWWGEKEIEEKVMEKNLTESLSNTYFI